MAHLIRVKLKDGSVVGLDPIRAAAKVKSGEGEYADGAPVTAAADMEKLQRAVKPQPTARKAAHKKGKGKK